MTLSTVLLVVVAILLLPAIASAEPAPSAQTDTAPMTHGAMEIKGRHFARGDVDLGLAVGSSFGMRKRWIGVGPLAIGPMESPPEATHVRALLVSAAVQIDSAVPVLVGAAGGMGRVATLDGADDTAASRSMLGAGAFARASLPLYARGNERVGLLGGVSAQYFVDGPWFVSAMVGVGFAY